MEIENKHKELCGKIATCEEKGKKFTLNNAADFIKVQIDGGVFPNSDKTTRCDYLFYIEKELKRQIEIFVELKGVDVTKAIKQLESSLQMFATSKTKYAFAIPTNVSPAITATIQKKEREFREKWNTVLKVKAKSLQCNYNSQTNSLEAIRN